VTRAGTVALVGWTNVGKSTLLNRFVGQKVAAVAEAAQTTRTSILGVCNVPERGQIVFCDTPGLHAPRSKLNQAMVERARQALDAADAALLLIDASRELGAGDRHAADWFRRSGLPGFAALNKIDRLRTKTPLLPMMHTVVIEWGIPEAFPISALTGEGCVELRDRLLELLPEGPPLFPDDQWTDQTERRLVEEWVRERLVAATRQELPHATAVLVERWDERADGLIEIGVSILVERDSQKAIVIGLGGALLKRIGSEARALIEQMLGRRVFLTLHVRTHKDWRNDEGVLRALGLH
jgi:GTPase